MFFDTHTHPQFPQYDQDREEMLKRILDEGVFMICVGTDLEMSQKAIALANQYDGVWASVGLHPNDNTEEIYDLRLMNYADLLNEEKVVAIGEVGLDYYRTPDAGDQERQRIVLKQFVELSIKSNKPLIIHCRDAHGDMIDILKSYLVNHKSSPKGVIHSFTSTWKNAKKYLDLGFYIGLNGIITFARDYDEAVQNIPLDRILLETDAPYLTPIPFRGKRNESQYIKYITEKIAELKGISVEEVAKQTTENAKKLFMLHF